MEPTLNKVEVVFFFFWVPYHAFKVGQFSPKNPLKCTMFVVGVGAPISLLLMAQTRAYCVCSCHAYELVCACVKFIQTYIIACVHAIRTYELI